MKKRYKEINRYLLVLGILAGSAFIADAQSSSEGVPAPDTKVAGIMVYNENWQLGEPDAGVYYIEVKPGGSITPIYKNPVMADVVCALKKDNLMYTAEATQDYRYYYRQMNVSDWSTVGTKQEIDVEDAPGALTYDATLGKAFGSFWNENYGGFSYFGDFNLNSASWTSIDKVQRDERDIFALAADGKGTIYCLFGAYNYLATLDPVTGQVNRIKTTDFEIDTNWAEGRVSSMCYDEENDRLIAAVAETLGWGANKSYRSGLYTINPHTGETSKVMDLPGNACFAGLYVVDEAVDPTAPGEPTGLSVNLQETSIQGTVSFTMPSKTVGGSPLSGSLVAIINLNGKETTVSDLSAGQQVTTPVLTFINGENILKVTIADSQKRGGSQSLTFWAGEDSPLAPSDVNLTIDNGRGLLTWKAPTGGVHNGNFNVNNVKYRVVRQPENKVVADALTSTNFTDSGIDTSYKIIYYTVTAYNSAGNSTPAESNRALSIGAFQIPYSEGFDTADDFALWTVEDINGGSTWTYNNGNDEKAAEYKYDDNKLPGDDWLISPPIHLEAGKSYKLSYKWRVLSKNYPESFEIFLGAKPEASSMNQLLTKKVKVTNTAYQTAEQALTVASTGSYHIGIHCFSDGYMYVLRVDDIEISEMDSKVPAAVNDLTITPAPQGVRSATVKFTVPSVDSQGNTLTEVSSVKILRNSNLIHELTQVNPGQQVEYIDNDITTDGMMKYSVVCENSSGAGIEAVKEVYVGIDAPGAVTDLTISEVNNHPFMKWTAPSSGVNGGWFDVNAVIYRIVRSDGTVISENCKETQFTDNSYTSPTQGQDALWYLVTPYVGDTKGAYAQTELLLCGTPYATPMVESFANADMKYYPWIAQSDNAVNYSWTLDNMGYNPQISDQNGDKGLATFHSVGEPSGTVSYFYSPKFDISNLENPVLNFYIYHAPGDGNGSLEVVVSAGTDTFEGLQEAPAISRTSATGWIRYSVSLSSYKTVPWIRIGFKGTGDGVADIYLDNVSIENGVNKDLALTSLKVPTKIAAGEHIKVKASILNNGIQKIENGSINLFDGGGKTLGSMNVPALEAGKSCDMEIPVEATSEGKIKINATLVVEGDENLVNNSLSADVNVVKASINSPQNLSGNFENGVVSLTWEAPASHGVVTDDVEDYEDFAIDGVGDWTMWDGDYDTTYIINTSYGDYPNSSARKAFQVCNADLLGINIWDEGKPHSGNKMFMAMCNNIYVNNDWLISPELNGKEQWISFYARSFTLQNLPAERMRVWYSTTDNDPANFTEITSSYVELPGSWQKYEYYLPEGAKYFAINCVSDGAYAMFVDDISFNDLTVPTWVLDHYEIYRDGQKIGDSKTSSYSYAETNAGGSYTVKAIYDRGESGFSDPLILNGNGSISDVNVLSARVFSGRGNITICDAEGLECSVFSTSGSLIFHGVSESDRIVLITTPGIYIVRIANRSYKLVVR
ncbi:MAG: choice-of-anchor J domain-containing protein [Muribaculaceae bacterium]|nr:choice-of-anchor J domain-containing protein [Muribaculaceae bacterium]